MRCQSAQPVEHCQPEARIGRDQLKFVEEDHQVAPTVGKPLAEEFQKPGVRDGVAFPSQGPVDRSVEILLAQPVQGAAVQQEEFRRLGGEGVCGAGAGIFQMQEERSFTDAARAGNGDALPFPQKFEKVGQFALASEEKGRIGNRTAMIERIALGHASIVAWTREQKRLAVQQAGRPPDRFHGAKRKETDVADPGLTEPCGYVIIAPKMKGYWSFFYAYFYGAPEAAVASR